MEMIFSTLFFPFFRTFDLYFTFHSLSLFFFILLLHNLSSKIYIIFPFGMNSNVAQFSPNQYGLYFVRLLLCLKFRVFKMYRLWWRHFQWFPKNIRATQTGFWRSAWNHIEDGTTYRMQRLQAVCLTESEAYDRNQQQKQNEVKQKLCAQILLNVATSILYVVELLLYRQCETPNWWRKRKIEKKEEENLVLFTCWQAAMWWARGKKNFSRRKR